MAPDLSIIIVNFNGRDYLGPCLHSIEKHADCACEIIVVDNASTDGSQQYLRDHHPNVRLVLNSTNRGFAAANNIGVQRAAADTVLLLNSDTRLMNSLRPALDLIRADAVTGVVGCRLLHVDGSVQPSVGYLHTPCSLVLSWTGLGRFSLAPQVFKRIEEDEGYYGTRHDDVAWVSGAFLMTRKPLWDALGGLDERFFMYVEEVDFCRRVRMAGSRVCYLPEVMVTHLVAGGREWIGEAALRHSMRSYIAYTRKYYGRASVMIMRLALGAVMYLRSWAYDAAGRAGSSAVMREKARGSRSAASLLWKGDGV